MLACVFECAVCVHCACMCMCMCVCVCADENSSVEPHQGFNKSTLCVCIIILDACLYV
jgi:hypothetical protein